MNADQIDIQKIIRCLQKGKISKALKKADKIKFEGDQKTVYIRKRKAFSAGLKGQDLIDWIEEMKVLLIPYQPNKENYEFDNLKIWHDLDKTDFRYKLRDICSEENMKVKVKVILIEDNIEACSDATHEILKSFIKYDHKEFRENLTNIKGGMSYLLRLDNLNHLKNDWTVFVKAVFGISGTFEQIPMNFRNQGWHKQAHIVVHSVDKFDDECFRNFQMYYDFWTKLNPEQPIFLCIHLPKDTLPRNTEILCNYIFCYSNEYEKVEGMHFRRFLNDHKAFYKNNEKLYLCKSMTFAEALKQLQFCEK